ncbi:MULTISPECIES: glycosyltransferase family 2 protein [Streptococcus]|uniref:Glycosyltransferase family 2 protein n=1 Tax=Streptococcus caledonicus TaxID=2614158 RepID=A0ABW0UD15_9STRE|nr:glycosyltransferase family 2 protein [Streptococcus sp. S784/96/1]
MNLLDYKISFIVPTYNTEVELLEKCLNSIVNTNISNFEIILVDDGSTSKDLNLYLRDINKIYSKLILIRQENQGSASARNNGLDNCSGEYIFFVDADDIFDLKFLNLPNFEKNVELIIFDYKIINLNTQHFTRYVLNEHGLNINKDKSEIIKNILYAPNKFKEFSFGAIWAKCFSKKFLDANKIRFKDKLRKTQDRIFMLDVIINSSKISYFPLSSYNYSVNLSSITHKLNYKMIDYCKSIFDEVKKYDVDFNIKKYFIYNIFHEMLLLTYFHKECTIGWFTTSKEVKKLYSYFEFDRILSNISLQEIEGKNNKLKFIMYKYHLIYLLRLAYRF